MLKASFGFQCVNIRDSKFVRVPGALADFNESRMIEKPYVFDPSQELLDIFSTYPLGLYPGFLGIERTGNEDSSSKQLPSLD